MKLLIFLALAFSFEFSFAEPKKCIDLAVAFNRPVIKTKRLQLRPLRLGMIEPLMDIHTHPKISDNFGLNRVNRDEILDSMYEELANGFSLGGHLEADMTRFRYGVYYNNKLIGVVTLRRDVKSSPSGSPDVFDFAIGRAILPEYWGLGFAPEFGVAMIDHIFATTSARSVVAFVYEWNSQSYKTWERLGFEYVSKENGTIRMFIMRRADWAIKRSKSSD